MSVISGQQAWLLHDGRAGHWRQVRALAGFLPLETVVIPVNIRPPWRWFAPYRLPFGLSVHSALLANVQKPPQVIISCGRRSALAARWLQHHFGGRPKTIQILDCGLPPARFNWVITPRHDELEGDNVIAVIGSLNPVNDQWLARAARDPVVGPANPNSGLVLLLGGPTGNFAFSRRWFRGILEDVCKHLSGRRLTLVESPRTPGWAIELIDRLPANYPVQRVAWSRPDPEGSEARFGATLAQADSVLVTADSVNLVSEACASGKPVCLLGIGQARGKIARFCHQLVDEGFALEFEPGLMKKEVMPMTRCLRETQAVAQRLIDSGLLR